MDAQVQGQPKRFCPSKLDSQRWGWGCPGQKQEAGKSLDYLHFKFLAVHAHCSGHCSHSLQLRTLFTLIAIQDIVDTDCNSGHRHWAGILGEVGRGHCASSKWTSIDLNHIKCLQSEIQSHIIVNHSIIFKPFPPHIDCIIWNPERQLIWVYTTLSFLVLTILQ